MSETYSPNSPNNPDNWSRPAQVPHNPAGTLLGDAPGFRKVRVVDHPSSKLVEPDVPTRSMYAGFDPYTGDYVGESSRYYLHGSLPKVYVREEIACGLEAVHNDLLQYVPDCGGICVLDSFRTDTLQKTAVRNLTQEHLRAQGVEETQKPLDQALLFECARKAGQIWVLLGLEEDKVLQTLRECVLKDEKLMRELNDFAAKDAGVAIESLTEAQTKAIVDEYIGIVFNTGFNNDRHPQIASATPLINNGPHLSAGATDAKILGPDGQLWSSHVPVDYPVPEISGELTLETAEGIKRLREKAAQDPWLKEHFQRQKMDPKNLTDANINEMRRHQRIQTNVMMLAGTAPYISSESWHVDWPENPTRPSTGAFVREPSSFLKKNGWRSGNPSYVTEMHGPGSDFGTGEGVPAVFGGKQAFQEARKLKIIE